MRTIKEKQEFINNFIRECHKNHIAIAIMWTKYFRKTTEEEQKFVREHFNYIEIN